jgi:hypothetical protein
MNGRPRYAKLGPNGEIILCDDLMEWAQWFEQSHHERQIKRDKIQGFLVSTVFLGLDHSFGFTKKQVWFETMVFRLNAKEGFKGDGYGQWRYSTLEEAKAGHAEICEKVRTGEIGE